jgi:hypothetical protein
MLRRANRGKASNEKPQPRVKLSKKILTKSFHGARLQIMRIAMAR